MVHPTRSSNSCAGWTKTSSKISPRWSIRHAWPATVLDGPESRQDLPRLGDNLLEKRPVVSHGDGTREGNGRVGAKRQDATAANAGTAATKTGTSSSNRPNNQVPQRSINIENGMSAFSPNERPSGLLPGKNLSSESQTEDRHIHASRRQGAYQLGARGTPVRPMAGSADVNLQAGTTITSRGLQDAVKDAMAVRAW